MVERVDNRIKRLRTATQPLKFQFLNNSDLRMQFQLRELFLDRLEERVKDPSTIAQGSAPLCGPAAFIYCIAKANINIYGHYVLDLIEHGVAYINNLKVEPSSNCKNAADSAYIDPVDWVALASLRDSSNAFFSMNSRDSNIAGITAPGQMREWFRTTALFNNGVIEQTISTPDENRIPATGIYESSNSIFSQNARNLLAASNYYHAGYNVCLLIKASIIHPMNGELGMNKLAKGTAKSWWGAADHWIVLNSSIQLDGAVISESIINQVNIDKKRLNFTAYTWQKFYNANNRIPDLTLGQFLRYYFGYVVAK